MRQRPSVREESLRGAAPIAPSHVALVAMVAGACGLYFGLTSAWQIPVESAQVLAGVVSYPADNPFYMYHVQSWTLLHQLPALALACGLSEPLVSLALACLAAVLNFEALSLATLAFSRDRFIACAVPSICLMTRLYEECGAVYQTHLVSDLYWATYGVTGNGYVMFTWSLIGLGFRRPAALLCGLGPAVHPLLGTWCAVIAAASLACDWRAQRLHAMTIARWFAAGAIVALASFAAQRYLARGLSNADPELASRLLKAFVAGWDNHRVAYPLDHVEWKIGWCALAVAAAAYAWNTDRLPRESLALLRIVLLASLAGVVFCPLTHFLDRLPEPIARAMPGRFINLAALAFPPLVIGLAARGRRESWLLLGLLTGLMIFGPLRTLTLLRQLIYVPPASKVFVAGALILTYLLAAAPPGGRDPGPRRIVRLATLAAMLSAGWAWRGDWRLAALVWLPVPLLWLAREGLWAPVPPRLSRWLYPIAALAAAAAVAMAVGLGLVVGLTSAALAQALWRGSVRYRRALAVVAGGAGFALVGGQIAARADLGFDAFRQWRDDPVFSAARRSEGLILTAPRMGVVQLRTRRGVVLNGEAMNQITYVPRSGPSMNRVLKGIYGDDLLKPRPAGWVKLGGLLADSGRQLWEARQPDEWRQLADEFGFTNVLTCASWNLQLPVVALDSERVLYAIPPR